MRLFLLLSTAALGTCSVASYVYNNIPAFYGWLCAALLCWIILLTMLEDKK